MRFGSITLFIYMFILSCDNQQQKHIKTNAHDHSDELKKFISTYSLDTLEPRSVTLNIRDTSLFVKSHQFHLFEPLYYKERVHYYMNVKDSIKFNFYPVEAVWLSVKSAVDSIDAIDFIEFNHIIECTRESDTSEYNDKQYQIECLYVAFKNEEVISINISRGSISGVYEETESSCLRSAGYEREP
jgi:hypothetical protein